MIQHVSFPARFRGVLACALAFCVTATGAPGLAVDEDRAPIVYRPKLAVPEVLEPFLPLLEPGSDEFKEERYATALDARLRELADRLAADPRADVGWLLAPEFRGARLFSGQEPRAQAAGALDVRRSGGLPAAPSLHARAFAAELRRLLHDIDTVVTAEFLIIAIEVPEAPAPVRTDVRYDIVGAGRAAGRIQHTGVWRMSWTQASSSPQVTEWAALSHVAAHAKAPLFTEITATALAANESFRQQLSTPLDDWNATLDSVLTRDSNGHHGVSVGDADGDGLEDLYVAQPAGLPNRLFRARGDSTFEDVTDRSGLGVLDDTAQSLFADVDNDGDQDLVLSTWARPLLFLNDGPGRFSVVPEAFQLRRPIEGVLTSIAMGDYDRDGFLDLYLCVYSYFFGAGEEKAGTPAPYYDARNGPPGILLRNDGHGRFVDVTAETGLDLGNDRYHFAAVWADYDGDGWQDLFVANDFGTKNLYRNTGLRDGKVTFEEVAAKAGVLDHGAGMSVAFLDYDNDGLLDLYTGNMWSANGLRVTASPAFMPDAPDDVRALYRRHARGNSLFRNRGDGGFEEKTVDAGVEMGRWAWSSDALDFDSDGWEDLYVVNGMLTRPHGPQDLDGFFWRQVVARSPLTRVKGTPYDDAWRAINELLVKQSIASRQRNVFYRNDGQGRFDDVSGAVGLDFDQDGRSFAVLDLDRDGDPDLALMAARHAPHLRIFRNEVAGPGERHTRLSVHLTGTASNRDAVGARVVVETDRLRRTKVVHAGSGFISQHSKELLFGLGGSGRVVKLTVLWPSGEAQEFTDVPLNRRIRLVEGGTLESEPLAPSAASLGGAAGSRTSPVAPPPTTWLYEPFPAPEFSAQDVSGRSWSLAALKGRPAVLLFWSPESSGGRAALEALAAGREALSGAGIEALAIAVEPAGVLRPIDGVPVIAATRELALSYAILNRHLFMNRQDLILPTAFLLDASGNVVGVYRHRLDAALVVRDAEAIGAAPSERLRRALPFAGTFQSPLPSKNYLPYGRELLDQGLDRAAVVAFERAAQANPSASTLYRLGTLLARTGETSRAQAAYERALALQPDLAEAHNDLGTLLARGGDLVGAIGRFRQALSATPDYPDALNNLGYALLLTGQGQEARSLYERALALQPDFPEALNNLGLLYGRAGDLGAAERYFREALARRQNYGEAANNVALALVARGELDDAVRLLEEFLLREPAYEPAYVTLAKIHLSAGRDAEGIDVLERLLQRNPTHPLGVELLREYRAGKPPLRKRP